MINEEEIKKQKVSRRKKNHLWFPGEGKEENRCKQYEQKKE